LQAFCTVGKIPYQQNKRRLEKWMLLLAAAAAVAPPLNDRWLIV
jgi:hypothetical protein